jgi:hypothetical protein
MVVVGVVGWVEKLQLHEKTENETIPENEIL